MPENIDAWNMLSALIAVLAAWSTVFLWAIKVMLTSNQRHVDERFKALDEALAIQDRRWQSSDRDLLRLKADLPKEYVRREDWIRFGATIDTKLDRVASKIDLLQQRKDL